ncbi:hypothetical protein M6D81_13365 [Paenibacillus sp. J5C_2022]|uniref:hypothetical protein n=1 Tax=Paenibacillus sp. J5C2022 TaxID=2977129 RepID=UPI0021D05691|nr:hypothetical protein [Paenibacillus sp. J5C2022]MCU6709687.1 hypothetical protein [Paenibacillus sp. J5C2022]
MSASDSPFVRTVLTGIEIGEHEASCEQYIALLERYFHEGHIDFIVIFLNKRTVPRHVWTEWVQYFAKHNISFAFLYSQDKMGAGKESQLTSDIVNELKAIAGSLFLGDMVGEWGGIAAWQEGNFTSPGLLAPEQVADMRSASRGLVRHVGRQVALNERNGVPATWAVDATVLYRYLFEGGVNFGIAEAMASDPELLFAALRGASRAYRKSGWGSHIAHEWYGGYKNDDPLKYKRLKLAYYQSFLAGASLIYPESGHFGIYSYGEHYEPESWQAQAYRASWNQFSSFTRYHARPEGNPITTIGFVQGADDGWTGWWGGATVWNQFSAGEDWHYGAAERSWELIGHMRRRREWQDPTVFTTDATTSASYGQYDLVPIEAPLSIMKEYQVLIFLGWNTMDEDMYDKLKRYVYEGGKLFMAVPHLNTNSARGDAPALFRDGDVSDLFGCRVHGADRKRNWGIKFVRESHHKGYAYPVIGNGIGDPLGAEGPVECASVELMGADVIARLSDRFRGWPEDSPPLLLEHRYGDGLAALITSWDFPGAPTVRKLTEIILRAVVADEVRHARIQVTASDSVRYAVYPVKTDQHVVYVLNTDYAVAHQAIVANTTMETLIAVESCGMRIVYSAPELLIVPESNEITIAAIRMADDRMQFEAAVHRPTRVTINSCKKIVEARTEEGPIAICRDGEHANATIELMNSGCVTLLTERFE